MAGNQKPSFNPKVVRGMTLSELVEMHPDADPEYVKREYEKIINDGKVLRKVTQAWLDKNPAIAETGVKVGDMYPM